MKETTTKDTYILENNCEVKVIFATIPHEKVFIRNENGKLIVSLEPSKN